MDHQPSESDLLRKIILELEATIVTVKDQRDAYRTEVLKLKKQIQKRKE